MAAFTDISVDNQFEQWFNYDEAVEDPIPMQRSQLRPIAAYGYPVSPASTKSYHSQIVYTPSVQQYQYGYGLPTPTQSSSSPEARFVPPVPIQARYPVAIAPQPGQPTLKRKLSAISPSEEQCKPVSNGRPTGSKRPHNIIEKKYRANLNVKIGELRDAVPALRALKKAKDKEGRDKQGKDGSSDEEDIGGVAAGNKLNKASILTKAVEYIKMLETQTAKLAEENRRLDARMKALEKNASREDGGITSFPLHLDAGTVVPESHTVQDDDSTGSREIRGRIPVPDSIRQLRETASQEHYGHIYTTPKERSRLLGKAGQMALVGTFGCLLLMDGFYESDEGSQSQERALFGIPLEILDGWKFLTSPRAYLSTFVSYCKHGGVLPLIKGFLAVSVLAFFVFMYLFNSKPNQKQEEEQEAGIVPQPTRPALPIETRRRAWSTSMQALDLPHHNFFQEGWAVTCEWINYSIRYWLGVRTCMWLLGYTEEDEAARIKAWDIAIDAQLAGGDMEISRSRSVLTIIGAGTLPHTPLRLMTKALHARLVLANIHKSGSPINTVATRASEYLASRQWQRARTMHEDLPNNSTDRLPGYLNYLLQMDCEDVFSDLVVQRAYNLMYDQHTSTQAEATLMDVVVNDHAIRSPIDAIAAWRSTMALQEALNMALFNPDIQDLLREHIQAALEIAPPGSTAETRASAVHAVLSDIRRQNFIRRAEEANVTGHSRSSENAALPYFIDSSTPVSAKAEIDVCLACARILHKLDQDRDTSGALQLLDGLAWPTLTAEHGSLRQPSILAAAPIFFVLSKLSSTLRVQSPSATDTATDVWPSIDRLAQQVCRWLETQITSGQRCNSSTTAVNALSARLNVVNTLSPLRRSSIDSHDTGYVSMEDAEGDSDLAESTKPKVVGAYAAANTTHSQHMGSNDIGSWQALASVSA